MLALRARAGEDRVGLGLVADMRVIGDIAGRAVEHQRRAGLDRRLHVDQGGQRVPIDRERFDGVARLAARVGDDHADDVADMIDLAAAMTG